MNLYRGEMLGGKDRQMPVEGPVPMGRTVPAGEPAQLAFAWNTSKQESKMGRRFTVIDNFKSEEFQCEYVAGLSYEARDEDEKLLGLLDKWIEEGKVREGGPEAIVSGGDAPVEDDKK